MPSSRTWMRYVLTKFVTSIESNLQRLQYGTLTHEQTVYKVIRDLFTGHITFVHSCKGEEMVPTFSGEGATVLIRPLPGQLTRLVYVGDVVLLRDPRLTHNQDKLLLRRVAATEHDEMLSMDANVEPFCLEEEHCWVLCDNEAISPKDATDSRTFGPLPINHIVGRAIYAFQSDNLHGPVQNSDLVKSDDFAVLATELDINKLRKQS